MSVIKTGYNYNVEQNRKEEKDYLLSEKTGKDGTTELVEEVVDYKKIQETNGTVEMWDTQKMRDAGINLKSITPRTQTNTKLEGAEKVVDNAKEVIKKIEKEIK